MDNLEKNIKCQVFECIPDKLTAQQKLEILESIPNYENFIDESFFNGHISYFQRLWLKNGNPKLLKEFEKKEFNHEFKDFYVDVDSVEFI